MKYRGILTKKIPWAGPRGRTLLTATDADARYDAAFDARLDALFRHHGVERGDFAELALALAFAHVPGFQVEAPPDGANAKRPRGRPRRALQAVEERRYQRREQMENKENV